MLAPTFRADLPHRFGRRFGTGGPLDILMNWNGFWETLAGTLPEHLPCVRFDVFPRNQAVERVFSRRNSHRALGIAAWAHAGGSLVDSRGIPTRQVSPWCQAGTGKPGGRSVLQEKTRAKTMTAPVCACLPRFCVFVCYYFFVEKRAAPNPPWGGVGNSSVQTSRCSRQKTRDSEGVRA